MIAALAEAGATFAEPTWIAAAERAWGFVTTHMMKNGRLHHAWRADRLQHKAMSDDLANMLDAALTLCEVTGKTSYILTANRFAADLDAHYHDDKLGGYFFTADDAEALIVRTRSVADNATPAANGTLTGLFTKLGFLTGNAHWHNRADELIRSFAGELNHNIFPLGSYLSSFETALQPLQVILIGTTIETADLAEVALKLALPTRILMRVADGRLLPAGHPAHGKVKRDDLPTAYVCVGQTCSLPVTDAAHLTSALHAARATPL